MEKVFTLNVKVFRVFLLLVLGLCGFGKMYAQPSCACKPSVQVSLDGNGLATVTPSMLLADGSTCDGGGTVTVMTTPTGNPIAGSPVVNCSHVGKTLYAKVANGGNSCWSSIIVEDKLKPVISCAPGTLTLTCVEMASFAPAVTDNCPAGVTVKLVSENITVNNCGSALPANVLKRIVRQYQAEDAFGNKSDVCTFTFNVTTIATLGVPPITIPPHYDIADGNNSPLQCDGDWAKLPNGNPSPVNITSGTTVYPGTGTPYLGDVNLYNNQELYCNLMVTYTDAPPIRIKCTTKIMRSWDIIEWSCANRPPINRVQIIEIVDNTGPEISGLHDVTFSTSNHDCEAAAEFADADVEDNCTDEEDITVDITIYTSGAASAPVAFIKHGDDKTAALPVGSYVAVYTAYDKCYNSSTSSIAVEVEDNTPPVAICDEYTTIGLTSDGTAWVPASVIDDGSYDECQLAKLLVRRMNNPNCLPCETPEFPGFLFLGEYGSGSDKHYYYLSLHAAMAPVAYKTAKAMGGYVVSYESLDEAEWVADKAYAQLPADYNRLLIGYTDRVKEGTFVWESGAKPAYTIPWVNGEPDGSGDYVVQRKNKKWRDIGNDEAFVKYVVEISDPCGWSSYAQFCCADIGGNKMIGLRAIDASGNYNDCMVSAVIQDKIGPVIDCPDDRTVNCDFAFDPKNLRKDFGWPTATDNCENLSIMRVDSTVNMNGCRIGSITRKFRVTDAGGRTADCTQTITFQPSESQLYKGPKPGDLPVSPYTVNGCGSPSSVDPSVTGRPVLTDGACSLVGADYKDEIYYFNNPSSPACFKILRRWTVIDWCQPTDNGYRTWVYVQEIKVIDNIAPVFGPLAATVSADTYDADCATGNITLGATATDVCTTVLKYSYKIDEYNDGTFLDPVNGTGNAISFTGTYPVGTHKIVYTFEDKCGNLTSKEQIFRIINRKAPNAYVKQGLAMSLMDLGGGEGMAEVWASDFDNGSSHPCNYRIMLSFTPVTVNALGQMVGTPNWVYDCDDEGENDVTIWVAALTSAGDVVQSSVNTFIDIQDNNNVCSDGRMSVNGNLTTETDEKVQDVFVQLFGSEKQTMSDENGQFNFSGMPTGGQYSVVPTKNDDPLNGVSTLDLVMIQRHILGIEKLGTPYRQVASDINKDGKITASDLVELRKLILGTITGFETNKSWRFVDRNYQFQDPANAQGEAFPEIYNIDALTTDMTTDFIAVKTGDVNGNAKANAGSISTDHRSKNTLELMTGEVSFTAGEQVVVPVRVSRDQQLSGVQFTMEFDADRLEYADVSQGDIRTSESNFGLHAVAKGKLTFSWNDASPASLNSGDVLFHIAFTAKKSGSVAGNIGITSDITSAEAYDEASGVMGVTWRNISTGSNSGYELAQNKPNPFNDMTVINFEVPSAMKTTLTVHDVTGKVIRTYMVDAAKGLNTVNIGRGELNTGVFYYTLRAGEFTATRKMVAIE